MFQRIFHLLGCCRRILLLLTLLFVTAFAWLWWTLPDPDTFRPEIESVLREQFSLQQLQLGRLSWVWLGDLEIHADNLTLRSQDQQWQLHNAELSLTISMSALLTGHWLAEHIQIQHGVLRWQPSDRVAEQQSIAWDGVIPPLPQLSISVHDLLFQMHWQNKHRQFTHLNLELSTRQQQCQWQADETQGYIRWDKDGQLRHVQLDVADMRWLPLPEAIVMPTAASLQLKLQRQRVDQWQGHLQMAGASAKLMIPEADFTLPFQQIRTDLQINSKQLMQPEQWQSFRLNALRWRYGKNRIRGDAQWNEQTLRLNGNSHYLAMPLLWSWLTPIDDDVRWRNWLKRMHHGVITQATASVALDWPKPWSSAPPSLQAEHFRYHVSGQVEQADINLGSDDDVLQHAKASVELDEHGLDADIKATLPYRIGEAEGHLHIPWNTLMLEIEAKANNVNGVRLHQWVDASGANMLGWQQARVSGKVQLRWDPEKPQADFVRAELSPITAQPWRLQLHNQMLSVSAGTVIYQTNQGLQAHSLAVQGQLLRGKVNFSGEMVGEQWQFHTFNGQFTAPLEEIVTAFHLPVAKPEGILRASVELGDNWQGSIQLADAAWHNFLGQDKRIGTPMQLHFGAHIDQHRMVIDRLQCQEPKYHLQGTGFRDDKQLRIDMQRIETQAFRGSLLVIAPLGQQPWRMKVNAEYLRRSALPESLSSQQHRRMDKPWQLDANIDRFDWQNASMQGVRLTMQSQIGVKSIFRAEHIRNGGLHLQDTLADFRMLGKGIIAVEELKSHINGQQTKMTATLTPLADGGMRWQGIATTRGNFDQILQGQGISEVFHGGALETLFAGEGVLMKAQPWWQGMRGRLRMRIDEGSIAKGGLLTKLLAITSLVDLPQLLIGQRKDLTRAGLFYQRLQIEATIADQDLHIRQLAMRSTAMDMAGKGHYNIADENIDLVMVFRPLQNLDALLSSIPLLRDLIGGSAHSLMRKVYHLHGSIGDAEIEQISPSSAGLSKPGLIEGLLTLPDRWFGQMKEKK